MKKKSSKWLKVFVVLLFVFVFCGLFVYGCSKAVGYLSTTLKDVKQAISKMNNVDVNTLITVKASKYEDVYAVLRPNHPEFFVSDGSVATNAKLSSEVTLSYADFGAILGNILHQKESLATMECFSVTGDKVYSVVKISFSNAGEEYNDLEGLGLEQVYLVTTSTYAFNAGRIVFSDSTLTFGGLEKDGKEMETMTTYLGEVITTLKNISIDRLSECIQSLLQYHTITFGNTVTLTPKEAV